MQRTSLGCRVKFSEAFVRTLIRRLARTNEALLGQSPGRSNDMKAEADAQESTVVLPRNRLAG